VSEGPAAPRYETAAQLTQRIGHADTVVCADCGVFVMDTTAHTRFHSILSGHAWALAVLKTSHAAEHVHARWDVAERIGRRRFDSWSGDALAEVAAGLPPGDPEEEDGSLDLAGVSPASLLGQLREAQRTCQRLRQAYRVLTDEVIAGLTTVEHGKVERGGLPFCRCGLSLAGGDASGVWITHALAVREPGVLHQDLVDLLDALGLGAQARPVSPHAVLRECIARARWLREQHYGPG